MQYYPIALRIEGWGCLVVGGGPVALEKAKQLCDAGARVIIVSPVFGEGFDALPGVDLRARMFQETDLDDVFMAVAATNNPQVNQAVAAGCRDRGILCNVVDDPDLCEFILPATVDRGGLTVSVSTGGASPALAARIRRMIDEWLPEGMEDYVEFLRRSREIVKGNVSSEQARSRIARHLASEEGHKRFRHSTEEERAVWLEDLIDDPDAVPDVHDDGAQPKT